MFVRNLPPNTTTKPTTTPIAIMPSLDIVTDPVVGPADPASSPLGVCVSGTGSVNNAENSLEAEASAADISGVRPV